MVKFETLLKKEKCDILKEIIKLFRDGKLEKDEIEKLSSNFADNQEEHFRCCIYKEKAIAAQKVRLGLGCSPAEDEFELKNIMEYKQIVHVIRAACDSCPINRFTVTEACRGCIEHKCMDVCPVSAIVRVNSRAYINQDLCRECGLCKSVCPYNAISEVLRSCRVSCPTGALSIDQKERKALINEDECINCGACITACPFGAISDKSCIVAVLDKLVNSEDNRIYAVLAPAIGGQLESGVTLGKLKNALKQIGFHDVVEASLGADIVIRAEAEEFAQRMADGDEFMTTSCCPAFVNYIKREFPQLEKNISSTVSPMTATAKCIKNLDKNATVVFIGPCVAKKNEIKDENLLGLTDYVMTFEELTALLNAFDLDLRSCSHEEIEDGSIYARNFAFGGGVSYALVQYVKEAAMEVDVRPVKALGALEIKKALKLAQLGKLSGNFIEGMMCEQGCIGGPASVCGLKNAKLNLKNCNSQSSIKNISDNLKTARAEGISMHID